jgi:hypothetical protein
LLSILLVEPAKQFDRSLTGTMHGTVPEMNLAVVPELDATTARQKEHLHQNI